MALPWPLTFSSGERPRALWALLLQLLSVLYRIVSKITISSPFVLIRIVSCDRIVSSLVPNMSIAFKPWNFVPIKWNGFTVTCCVVQSEWLWRRHDIRLGGLHRPQLLGDEQAVGAHATPGPHQEPGEAGAWAAGAPHPGGNQPRPTQPARVYRRQQV